MRLPGSISPDKKIVYLHIPKTAGTSINHHFRSILGHHNVGWLGIDFSVEDLKDAKKIEKYKVLGGHFGLRQAQDIPFPVTCLSTVREPVSRALSYYRYVLNMPSEKTRMGLCGDFAADLAGPFGSLISNQQCAFLGLQNAADPINALAQIHNLYVAPVECTQALLDGISAALNVETRPLGRENEGIGLLPQPDSVTFENLQSLVKKDRELYDGIVRESYK